MFTTLATLASITFLVIAFNQKNINKYPHLAETEKANEHRSIILVNRRKKVYNLYLRLIRENNELKAAQANWILRVIDNRLATLTYKDQFKFN